MGLEVVNKNKNCVFNGPYAGRDLYITMYQDSEREFVVTHNANIKPVSYFTGRETELQDLRQRIEEGRKSVLVSGMGGIGKTHICRKLFEEYLNKHAEDGNGPFRHIGYIEYNGDMGSSLQNCLKFKQQESPEQNQEAAWRELEHLAAGGKLLLFVDNVDKPISADMDLQRLKGIPGAVVLTSRQISFGDEFEPYRIGFLSMQQCIEIYERIRFRDSGKKIKPEEVPDLEYVIENLAGRHTITVELLAHLARKKLWTVKKLRGELEEKGFRLAFHKDGELVNIQKSYEILYDLSELTEAEQNILGAFSVLPYIPLAAETCNEWLLADADVSEDDDILVGLYQKGWLQFNMEFESYALHPVFAQFISGKNKQKYQMHSGLVKESRKRLEIPETGSALECQRYIPFAENLIQRLYMWDVNELAGYLGVFAYLLYYIAEYEKAAVLYNRLLQIRKEMFGENHSDTAACYCNLAGIYKAWGKYVEAEKMCKKSLVIYENVLGENHPDTASCYNSLAGVYDIKGEYKKAEELYKKSLQIREHFFGENHPNTAISYSNLAGIYEREGEFKKAEELYKKSLRIREYMSTGNYIDIARNYNNLAGVYAQQGEYGQAEKLYEESLRIRERLLGENHPVTAKNYNNLAYVYQNQGEYGQAEELYEKSLRILKNTVGVYHLDTATVYNNLAQLHFSQKSYEKAKELCEKSLMVLEAVLEADNCDTATILNNLADVYENLGEYEKAEKLYGRSLQVYKKVLGENHFNIAIVFNNIAKLYEKQGKHAKSLNYFVKAYKNLYLQLGAEHQRTRVAYKNMKFVYGKMRLNLGFEQWLEEKMKEADIK